MFLLIIIHFQVITFHGRGTVFSSKSSKYYAPILATEVIRYGPWTQTYGEPSPSKKSLNTE